MEISKVIIYILIIVLATWVFSLLDRKTPGDKDEEKE